MRRGGGMTIGRAILWFGGSYGVALLGYLVLNAAAGRMLGPSTFGYFVGALTLATVTSQLGLLGVHRSGLREASRLGRGDVDGLAALRRGVRAVSLVSLPVAGVLTGLASAMLAKDQEPVERVVLGVTVGLLVLLNGLQKLWANYLRGFGMVRLASMLEGRSGGALVAALQAGLVWAVWLFFPQWGLNGALAAVVVGFAVPVLLAWRAVHLHWQHATSENNLLRDLRAVAVRDWRFASVQVGSMLNASIEVWIAAILLNSSATSMMGAAQRLAALVILPMTALQVVFAPMIARLTVTGPREELESLLRTGATLAAGVTGIIWLPLVVAPHIVLRVVFGPGFQDAALPLMLLTTGAFVGALAGLAGLTLSMAHKEGITAKVQWAAVAGRVVIGSALAAAFGVTALALNAALVSAFMFVAMWRRTRREVGVNTALTLRPDFGIVRRPTGVVE